MATRSVRPAGGHIDEFKPVLSVGGFVDLLEGQRVRVANLPGGSRLDKAEWTNEKGNGLIHRSRSTRCTS